jgi:hypothetical protein
MGKACRIEPDEMAVIQQSLSEKGFNGLLSVLQTPQSRLPESDQDELMQKQVLSVKMRKLSNRFRLFRDLLNRCVKNLLNIWKSLMNKQDDGEDPAEDCQTVLMVANPADFRMAMLAEGQPGTPEENEGLRAFILVDEFLIGRDPKDADLCLSDPGIGRLHARITRRAGSFFICDLGSRNGTRLDNRRLLKNAEQLLPDQCVLQFAERPFYFQADGCG